jgi:hypothetical protein
MRAWSEVGIRTPSEVSEYSTFRPGERSFGLSLEADRYTVLNSLAYSILPPVPPCALDGTGQYPGILAEGYLLAWLDAIAGMPRGELVERFGDSWPDMPNVLATVDRVRSLPADRQRAWFDRNTEAMRDCRTEPSLDPDK